MEFTDLLTIAMPVYERKDFFLEAIESVLSQTIRCKVIVVDNCSSHDYFENICKQKGVTYYRNDTNIGMNPNFNRCFELATTEYVITLQDDDILAPNYVEAFCNAVNKHPDVDVFYCDFVRNTLGGKLPHKHVLPFGYMPNGDRVIEYAIKYKLGFPYLNSSIRRSKFTGFYTKFQGSNDWVWIYSCADKFAFYGDSRVLYQFRDHDNQDTKNNSISYYVTTPYIYDAILKEKAKTQALKDLAAKRTFWALVKLRGAADDAKLEEVVNSDHIFGIYLKEKLASNWIAKAIFSFPKGFVDVFHRACRKIGMDV